MLTTEPGSRSRALVGGFVGLLVGVVVLNSVLLPGYTWFYDLVFVPDLPWSDRTLGNDGSVPRAVPTDAVVALLERLVPGDVVQAVLLMAVFIVAGAGCGRLCRTRLGAAAAAVAACWNPYVVERLVIGHWSFLLGYAALPWIHAAGRDVAAGRLGARPRLLGWLVLAGLAGSTSGLIAALVAVMAVAFGGAGGVRAVAGRVGAVLIVTAAVGAAWLVPSLTRTGGVPADPAGVDAFAARADSPWGTWGSLLTGGGIWHEPSWPGSRGSVVTVGAALLVVIAVLAICARAGRLRDLLPLAVAGGIGLLVAGASSLPGGDDLVRRVVTDVPGGGLVRDGQKLVAPFVALIAVSGGRAVEILAGTARPVGRRRDVLRIAGVALLVAPVATLPDAPATGAAMGSVSLSSDVLRARAYLDDAAPGGVAVLPWTLYRRFDWNDNRVSLDPWNRLLDRRVVVDDDLPLSTVTVRGEDPVAADIGRAVDDPSTDLPAALRAEGVRWVVLHTDQPGSAAAAERLSGLPRRTFGAVVVVDLGRPARVASTQTSMIPVVVTGMVAVFGLGAWVGAALRGRRRRAASSTVG